MDRRPDFEGDALTIRINGSERVLPAVASIADVVGMLGLAGKRIAVERNGEVVPKSRYAATPLADGDQLEIVGAVGGG